MLERIATRLESEGRRLLYRKKPDSTTTRMLHSAFWVHGAEDLVALASTLGFGTGNYENIQNCSRRSAHNLEAQPRSRPPTCPLSQSRTSLRCAQHVSEMSLLALDFLYPPQALALLQQFAPKGMALKSSPPNPANTTLRCCKRLYSSSSSNKSRHRRDANTVEDGTERSVVFRKDKDILDEEVTDDVVVNDGEEDIGEDEGKGNEVDHVGRARKIARKAAQQPSTSAYHSLEDIPLQPSSISVDEKSDLAWEFHKINPEVQLDELNLANEGKRRSLLLRHLSLSTRPIDRQRIIEVVSAIEPRRRTVAETRYLVHACLYKDDTSTAYSALQANKSFTINSRHAGFEQYIVHEMNKERWASTMRAWSLITGDGDSRIEQLSIVRILGQLHQAKDAILSLLIEMEKNSPFYDPRQQSLIKTVMQAFWNALDQEAGAKTGGSISAKDLEKIKQEIEVRGWLTRPEEGIIMRLVYEKRWQLALDRYKAYKEIELNSPPSDDMLNRVLKACIRLHDLQGMQMVFEDWFRFGMQPNETAYHLVMNEFAQRGEAVILDELYHQYVERFGPSIMVYRFMLQARVKRGEQNAAIFAFESMSTYGLSPDIRCFNILLYGFVHAGDVAGALSHFKRLGPLGLEPNSITFTSLIYLSSSAADVENTEILFRLAQQSSIDITVRMYEMLVRTYVKADDLEKAEKVVEYVESLRTGESITNMWNMLLSAYAAKDDTEHLTLGFQHMRRSQIGFDTYTYNTLIHSLCRLGKMNGARQILGVLTREGFQPTAVHYATIMVGYLRKKLFSNVWALFDEMTKARIAPSWPMQTVLIQTALQQARQIVDIEQEIVPAAEAILEQAIAKLKGLDLTSFSSIKSAIPPYLFTSLTFTYAFKDAHSHVARLEKLFMDISKKQFPDGAKEDMTMIISLIIGHGQSQNWRGVQEYWRKAVALASKQAARIAYPSAEEKPTRTQRFKLSAAFSAYIQAATDAITSQAADCINKADVNTALENDLLRKGFELDPKNVNDYVRFLALSDSLLNACRICEERLIASWKFRQHLIRQDAPYSYRSDMLSDFFPYNATLEVLATELSTLYSKTLQGGVGLVKSRELLEDIRTQCPDTFKACNSLPEMSSVMTKELNYRSQRAVRLPWVPPFAGQ